PTIANRTFSPAPFGISATASSGGTVVFTSNTPLVCSVSGTNVTMLDTGTCSIAANQSGNAIYNAAPQTIKSFTISKASQTITFGNVGNKTMLDSPITVSATASSGLTPVTFTTTTPFVCTSGGTNGETITFVTGGTCSVRADQSGDSQYNAAASVTKS